MVLPKPVRPAARRAGRRFPPRGQKPRPSADAATSQLILTMPVAFDSAPYFSALVASSLQGEPERLGGRRLERDRGSLQHHAIPKFRKYEQAASAPALGFGAAPVALDQDILVGRKRVQALRDALNEFGPAICAAV